MIGTDYTLQPIIRDADLAGPAGARLVDSFVAYELACAWRDRGLQGRFPPPLGSQRAARERATSGITIRDSHDRFKSCPHNQLPSPMGNEDSRNAEATPNDGIPAVFVFVLCGRTAGSSDFMPLA